MNAPSPGALNRLKGPICNPHSPAYRKRVHNRFGRQPPHSRTARASDTDSYRSSSGHRTRDSAPDSNPHRPGRRCAAKAVPLQKPKPLHPAIQHGWPSRSKPDCAFPVFQSAARYKFRIRGIHRLLPCPILAGAFRHRRKPSFPNNPLNNRTHGNIKKTQDSAAAGRCRLPAVEPAPRPGKQLAQPLARQPDARTGHPESRRLPYGNRERPGPALHRSGQWNLDSDNPELQHLGHQGQRHPDLHRTRLETLGRRKNHPNRQKISRRAVAPNSRHLYKKRFDPTLSLQLRLAGLSLQDGQYAE